MMKYLLISINILMVLVACSTEKSTAENNRETNNHLVQLTAQQIKSAGIELGKIEQKNISSVILVNGKIDVTPQGFITMNIPLGGYVKTTRLLEGMAVKKGDVLATLEDIQYIQLQQDYLTAKAQFTKIESEFNRHKELNQSKAVSDKIFEEAKANYLTQQVLIKSLEEKLQMIGINAQKLSAQTISKTITIYSPIDGHVASVNAHVGKYLGPSDLLCELVSTSDLILTLSVFEKDLGKLTIGQKVNAFSTSNTLQASTFTIKHIGQRISAKNTVQLQCVPDQLPATILPGMFMQAEIETRGALVNAISDEAIVRFDQKNYVFIDQGNSTFSMQQVTIGANENGFTEISADQPLDRLQIVTKGAYNLLMALKNTAGE